MPMSEGLDGQKILVAVGCAVFCTLAHLAATQTSDKPLTLRKLRGQLGGAAIVGLMLSVGLDWQPWITVSPLFAFALAAGIGYVYGPAALAVAARRAASTWNFDPPPSSMGPPDPPAAPPSPPANPPPDRSPGGDP